MTENRSKSPISIYNYPENLNPFYEKENHKRLRFWKLEKKIISSSGTLRRGSLFGSLKDLLPLKSFRLQKKSSTLGINKSSASPPPLRKDLNISYDFESSSKYTSYDNHFRRTLPVGLRKGGSLQSMNEFCFGERNNRHRRTIQNGDILTDVSTSVVTLTPRLRFGAHRMTSGTSSQSLSTNPFENQNDVPPIKSSRKKRRAPLPPCRAEFTTDVETKEVICNNEFSKLTAALTEEFENFVKNETEFEDVALTKDSCLESENVIENNVIKLSDKISTDLSEIKHGKREETPDYIPLTVREQFHELRIEEDNQNKIDSEKVETKHITVFKEFEDKKTPILQQSETNSETSNNFNIYRNKFEVNPARPVKNFSKIIESIERSQKLLKVEVSMKLTEQAESEKQINELLEDLQNFK